MPTPPFKTGKKPAVFDHRVPPMHTRIGPSLLPPPPSFSNWYAAQASTGISLLGNDRYGNCVQCSIAHYLSAITRYVNPATALLPTEYECMRMYAEMTGFKASDPSTDQGTYFLGPNGAVQHWWQHGVVVGGKLNRPVAVATVDHRNLTMLMQAVHLMGFVFCGAQLSQDNVDSPFMWSLSNSPIVGGHEFLVCGYMTVAGEVYFDILTWNGMWRAPAAWMLNHLDEAAIVFDRSFFNARNINPAGVSWSELAQDMNAIHAA